MTLSSAWLYSSYEVTFALFQDPASHSGLGSYDPVIWLAAIADSVKSTAFYDACCILRGVKRPDICFAQPGGVFGWHNFP